MPRSLLIFGAIVGLCLTAMDPSSVAHITPDQRIHLTLDTSEAVQTLHILALRTRGVPIADSEWQTLFSTEPYQRLKKREVEMSKAHNDPELAFADEDFKQFVLSDGLEKRAADLEATLSRWKQVDLHASAGRVLEYLPAEARINAKVFPIIKPRQNSFVFEVATDPAIFLYLDPSESAAKFENTVAHELHHIGLGSIGPVYDKKIQDLPERAHQVAEWMGAFGEGLAMLAAAGGPDADPHAASSAQDRARWQHDLANFDSDLQTVNAFFLDALTGKLGTKEAVNEKAYTFFGIQGPWYTVGYRMAVIVEKRFGRARLIDAIVDPRLLLLLYNQAATEMNATNKAQLPLWSTEVFHQCLPSPKQ